MVDQIQAELTRTDIEGRLTETQGQLQQLDARRIAEIEDLRSRNALNVGLRKAINERFLQQREQLSARQRALQKVSFQLKPGFVISEGALGGVLAGASRFEEVAFRRSIQAGKQRMAGREIEQLTREVKSRQFTIEEEMAKEQRILQLAGVRGRGEELFQELFQKGRPEFRAARQELGEGFEKLTPQQQRDVVQELGFIKQIKLAEVEVKEVKDSSIKGFLEEKGIDIERPGGKVLFTVGESIDTGLEKGIDIFEDVQKFIKGEPDFEKRDIIGEEILPKGAIAAGTTAVGGEKPGKKILPDFLSLGTSIIAAPILRLKKKEEDEFLPQELTIGPARTNIERIKDFPGFIGREIKEKFGQIFIPEDPTVKFRDISIREAVGAVSAGFLIRGRKIAGKLPFVIAEELGFKGVTLTTPETEIPVKRTISEIPEIDIAGLTLDEELIFGPKEELKFTTRLAKVKDITGLTFEETESTITPEQFGEIGGFIAQAAAITLAPTSALLIGGAAITTAPKGVVTKQERIEGAFIFGTGAVITASRLRSIRRIAKARKTGNFGKLSNRELERVFLTTPEEKLADLRTKKVTELLSVEQRQKIGLRGDILDDITSLEISTRPGGKIIKVKGEPTEALAGKVKEVRKIGRKTKTFKGIAEISSSGEYTEVLDLGKGLKRITFIDDTGIGTTRIIKNGDVIIEKQIKTKFLDDLANIKPEVKINKIVIDQKSSPSKTILESKIKTKRGTVELTKILDDQGNLIISDVKEDLIAKKIKGEIEEITKFRQDPFSGRVEIKQDVRGFLDIIETGPRKKLLQIKKGSESILIKKRVGQEIVFGVDEPIDVIIRKSIKDESILKKAISPDVRREILEGSEGRLVSGFIKPDASDIKATKKAQEKLIKLIKQDRTKELKAFNEALNEKAIEKELFKKPLKVPKREPIIVTDTRPSIIGGIEPGPALQSEFAGPSLAFGDDITTFISEEIPKKVVVPPTSKFLTGPPPKVDVNIPLIFQAELSGKLPIEKLVGGAVKSVGSLLDIQQPDLIIKEEILPQLKITPELEQVKVLEQIKILQQEPQLELQKEKV